MTNYERDAWDETGDQGNGIIGGHLKCSKGHWTIDDEPIPIGKDGVKICVVMDSASTGQVLWQGGKITEKDVGRIADGFVPPRQLHLSWSPYTAFQAIRADEEALGELVTFTSSSWGGRYAFQNLVNPFRLKQRRQFPICALETKERGDLNGNIDPVFRIVGWSDRGNFGELLAPPAEAPAAIAYSPGANGAPVSAAHAAEEFDDIPF